MDGGAAGRASGAGGAAIPPLRTPRARLILSVCALAGASALAIFSGMGGPRPEAMLFVGMVAVALLALGMVLNNAIVVSGGIALLAGQFILSLYVRGGAPPSTGEGSGGEMAGFTAAVYGSALLLMSELAHWSLELRVAYRGGSDVLRRRALATTALVAASLAVGFSAAAIAQAPMPGSITLTAAGIGAVLAAMAIVGLLLWDRREG